MKTLFQRWLFLFVSGAFLVTFVLSWHLHSFLAENSAMDLLQSSLEDACQRVRSTEHNLKMIIEMSDKAALVKARAFAALIQKDPSLLKDKNRLEEIRRMLDVDELHVSDGNGILIASLSCAAASGGRTDYLGFDMKSTAQSREFMEGCTDPAFALVQKPQPNGILKVLFQYAGVARTDQPGIVQIGYRPERIEEASHLADVRTIASDIRIGLNGRLKITLNPGYSPQFRYKNVSRKGITLAMTCGRYLLTAELPRTEMYMSRNSVIRILITGNLILFGVIFLLVSNLLQKVVINGIYSVNDSLREITKGNLNTLINVSTTREFKTLSSGINSTVDALKRAIESETRRLDAELETGRVIQTSVLPTDFPETEEYLLHAGMFTAKVVGGDFYDFFSIDEFRTALLVADVSGKGITAALYMMNAKTLLKDRIRKYPPEEAFFQANQELCRNNRAHMFLTAFLAVLDRRTGLLQCVNAGHNPPVWKHADGSAEYFRIKPSLVLGVSPKAKYTAVPLQLNRADLFCLYTDGVTEAMNAHKELFGEEQLLEIIRREKDPIPADLVRLIREKNALFAGDVPQSDDITLLILKYKGSKQA